MTSPSKKNSNWCIIANAYQKDLEWMRPFLDHKKIIVCDGAYDVIKDAIKTWDITLDILLGDFDSIHNINYSPSLPQWVHVPDQNKTDLHKAIDYADSQGANDILILNALGNEMSHTLHNLRLLKRLHSPSRSLRLLHAVHDSNSRFPSSGIESIQYLSDTTITLQGSVNAAISLFGFPECVASSSGLMWDLNQSKLTFADQDSARNRLAERSVVLTIQKDAVLMMDASVQIQLSY
jgi:thiamine pyrophosphokinase